jgi:hypothetical protein
MEIIEDSIFFFSMNFQFLKNSYYSLRIPEEFKRVVLEELNSILCEFQKNSKGLIHEGLIRKLILLLKYIV